MLQMNVLETVHNLTSTMDNTVADAKNTVELIVYAIIIAICCCFVMYLIKIFKCFQWCCGRMYTCLCGSEYTEI
jgi:hypothetical protein